LHHHGDGVTCTYLITGPTRGLGLELVRVLAVTPSPPNLLLVGRAGPRLDAAAEDARRLGATRVDVYPCDLGSLSQVRAAASRIIEDEAGSGSPGIDGVVTNAALQMGNATSTTEDGIETTIGVGIVAHHLLLRSLQPILNPAAHIVFVGSGTHYGTFPATLMVPGPVWTGVNELLQPSSAPDAATITAGRRAYATSKLAVNYQCHEWNRRFGATLRANVYDPGLMPGTGLAREGSRVQQWAWRTILPALRVLPGVTSPEHSAIQLGELLTGRAHPGAVNSYFEIGRLKPASTESFDPVRERELFEVLDDKVAAFLPTRPS
jgi:NAD(P)-dependent dehydrogenase (short-subunit alcohol dehydrogenase family)